MEAAYISVISALAGTAVGGLTSFATTWLTQHSQYRSQRLEESIRKRELLYGSFIDEASRLLADSLEHQSEAVSLFVGLYATIGRMRLVSSPPVIASAERAVQAIVDAYQAPNLTSREMRERVGSAELDPMIGFSQACREELRNLGPGTKLT